MTHRTWLCLLAMGCGSPTGPVGADASAVDDAGRDASAPIDTGVPHDAWAPQGAISTVTGEVRDGITIRVEGSGFGASGPSIEVFDDFENGEEGDAVTATSPAIGEWDRFSIDPRHSGLYHHGGRFAARLDADSDPTGTDPSGTYYDVLGVIFDSPQTDVFVSEWRYLPEEDVIPGTGHPDGVNWKFLWIFGADTAADDDLFFSSRDADETGLSSSVVSGNNANFHHLPTLYWSSEFRRGRWIREQIFVHAAADETGQLFVWEIPWYSVDDDYNSTGEMLRMDAPHEPILHGPGECSMEPCTVFERVNINGYNRPTPNSHPTYDDVYIAFGPSARARVEIASARTWGDSAHASDMNMTLCTPSSWSDTAVECTVRQGSFAAGEDAYLFVVAGDGTISDDDPSEPGAQGHAIRIGG